MVWVCIFVGEENTGSQREESRVWESHSKEEAGLGFELGLVFFQNPMPYLHSKAQAPRHRGDCPVWV